MSVEISGEIAVRSPLWGYLRVVREFIARETALQKPRLFLWFPVFLSFGIAVYFALPAEPPLTLGLAVLTMATAALILAQGEARILWLSVFLIASGFACAQVRTHFVHTPILEKEIGAAIVSGRIETIEDAEDGKGSRLVLSRVQIEDMIPDETPVKIRLSVRADEGLQVGQRIRVLAGLGPPSPPVAPGAFDFQRYMYFQRIGGLGFAFKKPDVIGGVSSESPVERVRVTIDRRIAAALPFPEAAIARL